jgi:formate dehydrogenase subunit delta
MMPQDGVGKGAAAHPGNEAKLARMANQVATFFRSYSQEEAAAGIRAHLRAFWTRSMIRTLRAHAAAGGAVDPLVREALTEPPAAANPADKALQGPQEAGALASDAG